MCICTSSNQALTRNSNLLCVQQTHCFCTAHGHWPASASHTSVVPMPDCTNCHRLRLLCRRLYVLHAHIYFLYSTEDDKAKASKFRAEVQARFAESVGVKISDISPEALAPHPMPQFEIAFTKCCLQDIAPWLIFSRPDDYSILVHPFTSDVVSYC